MRRAETRDQRVARVRGELAREAWAESYRWARVATREDRRTGSLTRLSPRGKLDRLALACRGDLEWAGERLTRLQRVHRVLRARFPGASVLKMLLDAGVREVGPMRAARTLLGWAR